MMPIRDLAELIAEGTSPYADTDAARVARAYLEAINQDGWRGAYPGMCRDPEICRGMTHCPREFSCVS